MKFFRWFFKYGGMPTFKDCVEENSEEQWKIYGIIHHYTCMDCNFKWSSKKGPKGTYLYGEEGQTRCPVCKSPRCSEYGIDKWGISAGGSIYAPQIQTKKRKREKKT